MKNNSICTENLKYIDENVYQQIKNYTISADDLYLTIAGTIGNVGEVPSLFDGMNLTENAAKLTNIMVDRRFLMYQLLCSIAQEHFVSKFHQVAQPKLSIETASSTPIVIPPIAEQERIVKQVEVLLELVNAIDDQQIDLSNFVDKTKSKILELAMRGKLVPQDPSDEPAAEMLRRVNPKARIITDNPHSWNIPKSWVWTKMGDVFLHNTGKALNNSNSEGTVYEYITTSNVYWGRFELDILKKMPFKNSEIDKCKIAKGDLLVCEGGDVGRAAIWRYDMPMMIQNHLHRLRPFSKDVLPDFYFYVLKMFKDRDLIGGKGIALQGFSSNALHKLVVPLPPIREQKRIVIKIKELWNVLDEIKASLQS